jgi:pimeloyl-ACP methyl ester carboxylesterase
MLVHGLGADKSCFSTMEDFLHRAGYTVFSVSYSCVGSDIEACARILERETSWLLDETGADRVHVVAHSLGGVVLRWAAAHTRMREWLSVGITLGSPHRGTPAAHLAPSGLPGLGRIVSQLRPGALTIDDEGLNAVVGTRWIAIGGENDVVVPPKYARLPHSRNVRNAVVPLAGHMTLTRNIHCLAVILRELAAAGERGMDALPSLGVSADRPSLCA